MFLCFPLFANKRTEKTEEEDEEDEEEEVGPREKEVRVALFSPSLVYQGNTTLKQMKMKRESERERFSFALKRRGEEKKSVHKNSKIRRLRQLILRKESTLKFYSPLSLSFLSFSSSGWVKKNINRNCKQKSSSNYNF